MRIRWVLIPLLMATLAGVPLLAERYVVTILTQVYIYSIAAMALEVVLGYGGMVSMGHAALFALGAYTAGLVSVKLVPLFWFTLPAGVLAGAVGALLIGHIALRTQSVSFLMVTLAGGQMVYSLAAKWTTVTGGMDGLAGIPVPSGLGVEMNVFSLYWLCLLSMALTYWFLRRILASPFGRALLGIRENEKRMHAIGADVRQYKLRAFALSGAVCGLAGVLYAHSVGHVAPSAASWVKSGELILMSIVGGTGTLIGPVLGSFVVVLLHTVVSSWTERWMSVMGAVFILCVLALPGGLHSLRQRLRTHTVPEGRVAA